MQIWEWQLLMKNNRESIGYDRQENLRIYRKSCIFSQIIALSLWEISLPDETNDDHW